MVPVLEWHDAEDVRIPWSEIATLHLLGEIDRRKTQCKTSPSGLAHVFDQQQEPNTTHRAERGTIGFSMYRDEHATECNGHHD